MRRITRIDRSISGILVQATSQTARPYRCLACRHQASSLSTSSSLRADKVLLRDRVRRRIFGEENVPGQENPYTGPSQLLKRVPKQEPEPEQEPEQEPEPQKPISRGSRAKEDDQHYEPADTWDDLETVGGTGGWWKNHWDPEHTFQSFLPDQRAESSLEVTAALHRAMVEVFALKLAGRSLQEVSQAKPGRNETDYVQLIPSLTSSSGVDVRFSDDGSLEKIIHALGTESVQDLSHSQSESTIAIDEAKEKSKPTESEEQVAAERSTVDALDEDAASNIHNQASEHTKVTNYEELLASWDDSWLQISIADPEIKFAVLKRTLQLTGKLIPDSAIKILRTADDLLKHLITPPKPRKVAEALAQKEDLMTLPNISVWGKRITNVDKERKIGRWKVIEEELVAKGLSAKKL